MNRVFSQIWSTAHRRAFVAPKRATNEGHRKGGRRPEAPHLIALALAAAMPVTGAIADTQWTGAGGDNDWTNAANWSNGLPADAGGTTYVVGPDPATVDGVAVTGSGRTWVGRPTGDGRVRVEGGGSLDAGIFELFGTNGFAGHGVITGEDSVISATSTFIGAYSGVGYVLVESGGTLATQYTVYLGQEDGSLGSVTVTGADSAWSSGGTICLGGCDGSSTAIGIVTVTDGGVVQVDNGSGRIEVAQFALSTGIINIGAAEGEAAVAAGIIQAGELNLGSGNGSLIFNHTGTGHGFAVPISGAGEIRQIAGTTNFSGNNTAFIGATNVIGGALHLGGNLGDQHGGANGSSIAVSSGGLLTVGASRHLSAASITNDTGGWIDLEIEASLHGTGNTLNNSGTINVGNLGLVEDAGAINNLAGGVINFAGEGQLVADSDNAGLESVVNDGVINLDGDSTQTVLVRSDLVNQGIGTVNVDNGRLEIENGRLVNASAGAAVGGTGGVSIEAAGELEVDTINNNAGGEITSAGAIDVFIINNNAGATLTTVGTVTSSGALHNSGTLNAEGTIVGTIDNADGGIFNVTGALAADGGFDLDDIAVLNVSGGDLTIDGELSHQSTAANGIAIAAGRTLSANTIENGDTHVDAILLNNGTLIAASPIANAGTIQNNGIINGGVTSSGNLANAGTLNGGLTLNDGAATNSGTVNGGLTVSDGMLTNTGSVAGPIQILGGTFVTHAAGQVADITNQGELIFDQTADDTYAGILTGAGAFGKKGAGALTLTADSSAFDGATTVSSGRLVVNDALGGLVNLTGGTLGGIGTFGSVTAQNGGTFAPGNSIGTTQVASVTFETGSTYQVELTSGGSLAGTHNDLIAATGAAVLNGGTVRVTPDNGTDTGATYTPGTYTILTAAGGITGAGFEAVADDFAYLDFTLGRNANNLFLTSAAVGTGFCLSGMSGNQCGAANAVQALGAGSPLYDAMMGLTESEANSAAAGLSGDGYAQGQGAAATTALTTNLEVIDRVAQSFSALGNGSNTLGYGAAAGLADDPMSGRAWMAPFGAYVDQQASGAHAASRMLAGGLLFGADLRFGEWLIGSFAGVGRSDLHVLIRGTSIASTDVTAGIYGGAEFGEFGLSGSVGWSHGFVQSTRHVTVGAAAQTLTAEYGTDTLTGLIEINRDLDLGATAFTPYARVGAMHHAAGGFTETGGSAALSVAPLPHTSAIAELGVRVETQIALETTLATFSAGLGWQHRFGDAPAASNSLGSTAFVVTGTPVAGNALLLEAGVNLDLEGGSALALTYDGRFTGTSQAHAVKATLGAVF